MKIEEIKKIFANKNETPKASVLCSIDYVRKLAPFNTIMLSNNEIKFCVNINDLQNNNYNEIISLYEDGWYLSDDEKMLLRDTK